MKMKKIAFLIMTAIILITAATSCSKEEDIHPNYYVIPLYRTKMDYLENDHDYFIIKTYTDYIEMKINHSKVYEEEYFEDNILVIVNIAKSQEVELKEVSFKKTKNSLLLDVELEYTFSMEFGGFSILIEMSSKNIKEVLVK